MVDRSTVKFPSAAFSEHSTLTVTLSVLPWRVQRHLLA
jgi:hypothetical protein